MTNLGEVSYVLDIAINLDRERSLLGLSWKGYIEKVLKMFNMVPCSKGDKLSKEQSPQTEQEKLEMVDKPYASLVGSLMYAQVCTRPDLAFAMSILGQFQSNPGQAHWVNAKKVLRYVQRTKDCKLVYKESDNLELAGYTDGIFGRLCGFIEVYFWLCLLIWRMRCFMKECELNNYCNFNNVGRVHCML